MRNFQFFFIIFCIVAALNSAWAARMEEAPLKNVVGQNEFREFFTETLYRNISADVEEIQVTNFASHPANITVPQGKIVYRPVSIPRFVSPGKKFISAVVTVNGSEYGRVKMHGDVHFWGRVVCLSRSVKRNTILGRDDIETDFREISMLGDDVIRNPARAVGKKLKKSLRPGSVLHSSYLRTPSLVKRGDLVTIVAQNGTLQVSAPGEVRNEGGLGEMVKVKNLMSRRLLQARVVDKGRVEVEL